MSVIQEHNAKIEFIAGMANKYDYHLFKQFCADRGFEFMSFITYASIVEPYVKPDAPSIRTMLIEDCGSCGGGKVL